MTDIEPFVARSQRAALSSRSLIVLRPVRVQLTPPPECLRLAAGGRGRVKASQC
jgi:hypothetical protein